MGQKTGTSNMEKQVIRKAIQKALVMEYLKTQQRKQFILSPEFTESLCRKIKTVSRRMLKAYTALNYNINSNKHSEPAMAMANQAKTWLDKFRHATET